MRNYSLLEVELRTTEKQRKRGKQPYVLGRKDRFATLNVSRGDHFGVKWWAEHQNMTIAEAIHDIIHTFIEP